MMEVTQTLEVPCRDGSIVVTATRVQRKGRPTWSIWRSHCSGVAVASAPSGLSLWLQLKDGRRLPIPGVASAGALRLIATLGYVASDLPVAPRFIQPHTHLTTPCRGGTLQITRDLMTLEGASSWNLPRTAIAGVSAVPGPDSATLLISMRNGQLILVDGVPFECALQAIAILGYLPASLPPLPEMGPLAAMPDRRRRPLSPAGLRRPIVAPGQRRSVAPPGGRLVPVLTSKPNVQPGPSANGRVRGSSPTMEEPPGSSVMPGRVGATPGANGKEAVAPEVVPTLTSHTPPFAPPPEPARLPLEAFFWEEEEEGGFLRRLAGRLRMPALPALPEVCRPAWLHRPARSRATPAPVEWALPAGPRELRPPDWRRQPDTPASHVRPAEWQRRPIPHQSPWHRPTWLRLPHVRHYGALLLKVRLAEWQRRPKARRSDAPPAAPLRHPIESPTKERRADSQRRPMARRPMARRPLQRRPARVGVARLRRHDVPPPQVRPREWQRQRAPEVVYARPVEWERQPEDARTEVRPAEWQHRPVAQRSASRASAFISAIWGPIARPDAIAVVLPVGVVLLLLLIAAFSGRSYLSGRASGPGAAVAAQPGLKVFAGSQDGAIYVLDARTGALVWRYQTGAKVESAPAVVGGIAYIGSDDHAVYALRPATKSVLWRYTTSGAVASALTVTGGIVYAGSYDGSLYALRASDGMLLWRYRTGNWISAQPAVAGGVVYVGSYDDDVYALRASDGALLWRYHTRGMVASSPMVVGAALYVGSADDDVYALNARSGALLWRTTTGGSVYSSPALANGTLYVGSADTYVYALRASDGALLWRAATSGLVFSSPAVANGVVYIGSSDGYLYALRATGGSVLWRYRTRAAVVAPPAVARGIVYAGSADGSVYALSAGAGTLIWSYPTGGRVTWRVAVGP